MLKNQYLSYMNMNKNRQISSLTIAVLIYIQIAIFDKTFCREDLKHGRPSAKAVVFIAKVPN